MKTAKEILDNTLHELNYYQEVVFLESEVIEAMEKYASQFKAKPCPCSQQEKELQEINRINKATPK